MIGSGVAPLLATAAVGYWVVMQSEQQKGVLRFLGQLVGVVIILISLVGSACKTYATVSCYGQGFCQHPMAAKGMACPMVKRATPAARP